MPSLLYENRHGRKEGKRIAGIDEAGRGPLAGPVVTAAVILHERVPQRLQRAINDSKQLTAAVREELFPLIQQHSVFCIAEASVAEIDRFNIFQATMLAMKRAADGVAAQCGGIDHALIDGNHAPRVNYACLPIVEGDAKSLSIAAASILAKVTRDRLMAELHLQHPVYGWDRNAGYSTKKHMDALLQHGATPHHRTSFAPVREALGLVPRQAAFL